MEHLIKRKTPVKLLKAEMIVQKNQWKVITLEEDKLAELRMIGALQANQVETGDQNEDLPESEKVKEDRGFILYYQNLCG